MDNMQEKAKNFMERVANGALNKTREEVKREVFSALPDDIKELVQNPNEGVKRYEEANPLEDNEEYEYEEEEYEYEIGEDSEDDSDAVYSGHSFAFDDISNPEENLRLAAAAWRTLGQSDDFVASNPENGMAYFGGDDDFEEFCAQRDFDPDKWKIYEDSECQEIDCNYNDFQQVLHALGNREGLEEAKKQYTGFHWGDEPSTVTLVNVPGINPEANLTFLGVGREICYGSKKDGKFVEYYHLFGEETKVYPAVYALGDNCLVVFGGNMRVEDRGIVE